MNHRSLLVLVIAALLAIVGCSVSPDETFPPSGGGSTATGGQGGVAGQGGQGGVAGQGGQTSTGGQGGVAGQGGQGGAPEFFSCAQVQEQHLVVKFHVDIPPDKYFASDGSVIFSEAGFDNYPPPDFWGPLFVTGDKAPADIAADIGDIVGTPNSLIPSGTRLELAPGWTDLTDLGLDHIVQSWVCASQICSVDILCCYGTQEIGKQVDGAGDLTFNPQKLDNPVCVTP